MKKFLLAFLSVLLLVCAGSAAACKNKDYHLITFRKANGVTYVSEINSGNGFSNGVWEVRDGATITFTVELAEDATGNLSVYCNDDVLTAGEGGVYSVTVTSDIEITVDGIEAAGDYNRLLIPSTPGVVVNLLNDVDGTPLKNGMMVRSGTEIRFEVIKSEDYSGTPVVRANETVLTPVNGVYSFVMTEPTKITVSGITKNISLTFNKGDTRVDYIGTDGMPFEVDKPLSVEYGQEVVFDIKISVYYDVSKGYEVQSNTTIITPQKDGHYHVTIEDETTVSVSGLEQDVAFTARGDGAGTQSNPYRLSRPIDLYEMAMRINDSWYMGAYCDLYYELVADIDLDGEQLFVIGDGSTGRAYFGGQFNGNGYTISNYRIEDSRIEQSEFNQLYLPNIGMFGYVMPEANGAPVIKNLNLDSFTINANASRTSVNLEDYTLCVGSLAGATFGASISNVSATNGRIVVTGGQNNGAYVGGLIGYQFSEFGGDDSISKFDSGVVSCMTDVDISITAGSNGYVFAIGGISGALRTGDEHYTSYVLNCYSKGNIEGGHNAGGIVGYAYNHTAVVNCYSTGEVRAISLFSYNPDYSDEIYYANAGGLVGYAEYSTVIAGSFSTGYISAQARRGNSFCRVSKTVKAMDTTVTNADAMLPTLINVDDNVTNVTADFIRGLGWSENDWIISDGLPVLKSNGAAPSINVNFVVDSAFGAKSPVTLNSYKSLAGWGIAESAPIPEYISGNGGYRSYGYYFDAELNERVPRSYIITSDITLYVGYADYAEIAGVYYLGDSVNDLITLELTLDGLCIYRKGALNQTAKYSWDGAKFIIYYSMLGVLTNLELDENFDEYYFGSYYIFDGTIEEGVLSIYGGDIEEVDSDGYFTGNIIYLFPDNAPLKGYKQLSDFKYGSYYFDGGTYTFFGNYTGLFTSDSGEKPFSYSIDNNTLTLTYADNTKATATLSGGYVTGVNSNNVSAFDEFTGTWEKSFSSDKKYAFDGKGNWTYSGYDGESSGVYTVENGELTDELETFKAKFVDGFLVITSNNISVIYYKEGSFTGDWYYNGITGKGSDITLGITFDGIGERGYGDAHIRYSTGAAYDLTYEYRNENDDKNVIIYYHDFKFGELVYNESNLTLNGNINEESVRFTVYDGLLGRWISDDNVITSLEFNGNGFYNLSGDGKALSVKGSVRINGGQRVEYSLDRNSMEGSFICNSIEYKLLFNEVTSIIEVKSNDRTFYLALPDNWYGRELKGSDGKIYTFDGKGNLPGGGTLSVSSGGSYTYKISGDDIIVDNDATITLGTYNGNAVYVLSTATGTIYLTLNTPFTGSWVMGGLSGTLNIGDVYADNTASGSYKLYNQSIKNISLTYYPDGNYLTFREGDTVYRITATKIGNSYLLDFASGSGSSVKCIPVESADELQGKVYTISGKGGWIVFDGLGVYGYANGSAVVLNANGEVVDTLIYGKNTYGDWVVVSNYYDYVFLSCEENTQFDEVVLYRLTDDHGNHYAIVSPDGLYKYNVKDASDFTAYFIFNGCGEVKRVSSSGEITVYNYKIVKLDETTFKHTLEFTDKDGTIYSVTLDLSDSQANWKVIFN